MKHYTKFHEEAIALGIAYKNHQTDYISRDVCCPSGKDVYLTFNKAKKALKMRRESQQNKEIYKCHICGHFHLTTKDGKNRRPAIYSRSRVKNNDRQTRSMLESKNFFCKVRNMTKDDRLRAYRIKEFN